MIPMRKTNSMIFLGAVILLFDLVLLIPPSSMVCGLITSQNVFHARHLLMTTIQQQRRRRLNSVVESGGSELSSSLDDEGEDDVEEASVAKQQQQQPKKELDAQERVWRFVKKPLLHIGSKGATLSHGNSLRQLLDDHTVVKVKVNTRKFGGSLENAATALKELAIENGAPDDIEIVQMRKAGNVVLYGIPGTLQRMDEGTFPPPPPPPKEEDDETMSESSP